MPDTRIIRKFATAFSRVYENGDTALLYTILTTLPHIVAGERKLGWFQRAPTATVGDPNTEAYTFWLDNRELLHVAHMCRNVALTDETVVTMNAEKTATRFATFFLRNYPNSTVDIVAVTEGMTVAYPKGNPQ